MSETTCHPACVLGNHDGWNGYRCVNTAGDSLPFPGECPDCEGMGRTAQGWTDKNGFSEYQYGPCRRCTKEPA